VAIVTGGASGLGRAEAFALAARGAHVVVVDSKDPIAVVSEIVRRGGVAAGGTVDVSDPGAVDTLVDRVLAEFGDLHVVVNDVIATNLTATFLIARRAAVHWRDAHKRGETRRRALITTSSESTAKAVVAALTLMFATEPAPYGVDVNAIASRALDPFASDHVAAIVAWLASNSGAGISGEVLVVHGGGLEVLEMWHCGQRLARRDPWSDEELGRLRVRLFADRPTRQPSRPAAGLFSSRGEETA
jgi:nucleoside-diphosphate-sugar epimerase